jgi:hypothetical protein
VGLTPRELRSLRGQHGTLEAAIEARPDLADDLREFQRAAEMQERVAETLRRQVDAFAGAAKTAVEPLALVREADQAEPLLKLGEVEAEWRADLLGAVRDLAPPPAKLKVVPAAGGPHQLTEKEKALHNQIPRLAFAKVLALLEMSETANLNAIASETGVDRHDVAKIRDWRNGRVYEVQPGQIENTVILVKRPKTA